MPPAITPTPLAKVVHKEVYLFLTPAKHNLSISIKLPPVFRGRKAVS
jgi:hypothetical protein